MNIHPNAIIDPAAKLHESVSVGPGSIIEGDVEIGAGCTIASSVRIYGGCRIGANNHFDHGAVIGAAGQDLGFDRNKVTRTQIGDHNVFREGANIHRASKTEATIIGDHNYFMGNAHVGHDCVLGNHNVLTHGLVLAGHVTVGNYAFISGLVAVHQFANVGDYSMTAGCSKVVQDVPPYSTVDGNPAQWVGLNVVGLKRAGFDPEVRKAIKAAYQALTSGRLTRDVLEELKQGNPVAEVQTIIDFYEKSSRGVTGRGHKRQGGR
ncbi:MAG: acyl-ACP--UDP-N-acetylglucosamine O-acyltransferase [Leptospiraceae bacterium]|nr:acyl-ACP--UDP-N-acetylglucosamine O-acyltransferase [Leptospiraceae bacterium]